MSGRNGILAVDAALTVLNDEFTSALVFQILAGGVDCFTLRGMKTGRFVGVVAFVGPTSVRALGNHPVLRLAHGDVGTARL